MKKKEMDIVFLLDRSGSMQDCVKDTIGGFNSYIEKQRDNKMNTLVTTVLFDNQYELLHDRININKISNITDKEYFVRGTTALLDAIGTTIEDIDKKASNKVLFVITTDGLENASTKYTREHVKELIQAHPNWEFIYIGANIDSFTESNSIGISKKNTCNYKTNSTGIKKMFKAVECATNSMYENDKVCENWSNELNE